MQLQCSPNVPRPGCVGCLQGCPCPTEETAFELKSGSKNPCICSSQRSSSHCQRPALQRLQPWVQKHSFKQVLMWAASHQPRNHHIPKQSRGGGTWWDTEASAPGKALICSPFLRPLKDFLSKKLLSKAGCASGVFLASIHAKQLRLIICNVKLELQQKLRLSRFRVSRTFLLILLKGTVQPGPGKLRGGWSWSLIFQGNKTPLCLQDQNLKSFHGP